jgi:hypothetical protein
MATFSTRQAAKMLGLSATALSRYIALGKISAPNLVQLGGDRVVHAWTDHDIERVRKLLPKIKNGRKTRYKKELEKRRKKRS